MRTKSRVAETYRRDLLTYATVSAMLVLSGMFARTVVLNWLVGPGFVVVGVALLSRRRRREGPEP